MPYSWHVIEDQHLGFGRLYDTVTGEEMLQAAEDFCTDEHWQPGDAVLWDNRWITKLAITQNDAAKILMRARKVARHLGDSRAAAVMVPDLQTMGEHLIFMSGMNPDAVRVFSSLEGAVEWLGVPLSCLPEEATATPPDDAAEITTSVSPMIDSLTWQ